MKQDAAKTAPPAQAKDESWPHFGEDEIAAVAEVLRSGRVNQWTGDRVAAFEAACAARFGLPHAVAVANGSVALELALRALGMGAGDEVIVTARSFVASAACVSVVGATPVFADVDPDSQNVTADTIAPLITPRTKAVIPVHLFGWPAGMPAITALAASHGLAVIEDCAQAHGAEIAGQPAGGFGDAAAFSFCQDKIITTGGEGGMVLFRDEGAATRAWEYKDHGKSRAKMARAPDAAFRYVHDSIGTNWRLTEMQAAIGLIQLEKLDGWLERRRANAAAWAEAFAGCPAVRVPVPPADAAHAWYKFSAFLRPERLKPGVTRDTVLAALNGEGVRAFSGSCPEIYREGAFAGLKVEPCPVARELGETSLTFEVHPTLDPGRLAAAAAAAASIIANMATPA